MFKQVKVILAGAMLIGSLGLVGCTSTQEENILQKFEGMTPPEIVADVEGGSYQLGVYDATKWLEDSSGFTLRELSDRSMPYSIIKGFDAEEYYKGALSIVSFGEVKGGDTEDAESLKTLMDIWNMYNKPEEGEDKEEQKKEDAKKEEQKKEETGQCYDCGKYYPVSKMEYNGRSYHCGCNITNCLECGAEIIQTGDDYKDVCDQCIIKSNNEELYGTDETTYHCPDCGGDFPVGTLCDCDL